MNQPRGVRPAMGLFASIIALLTIGCGDNGGLGPGGNGEPPAEGWAWMNPRPQGHTLQDIQMLSVNTAVAVGEAGTILRTTNGGSRWNIIRGGYGYRDLLSVSIAESFGMAVGRGGAVLRTEDGGSSWELLDIGIGANDLYGVAVASENVATVVGVTLIRRTNDGGDTWVVQDPATPIMLRAVSFFDPDHGIAVSNAGTSLWTGDGGDTWQLRDTPITFFDMKTVAMTGDSAAVAAGFNFTDNTGSIFTSTNGGESWDQRVHASQVMFVDVSMAADLTGYMMGFLQGVTEVYKTPDGGETWNSLPPAPDEVFAIATAGSDVVSGVGGHGRLSRSTDGGLSWRTQSKSYTLGVPYPSSMAIWFNSPQEGFIGTFDYGLLHTLDGGKSWAHRIPDCSTPSIYFIDGKTGFAVSSASQTKILRTSDGGYTWLSVMGGDNIRSVHFADSQIGLGAGNNGLLRRTTNGGMWWPNVRSPAGQDLGPPFLLDPDTVLVLGRGTSIYRSTNGGVTSWDAIDVSSRMNDVDFNKDHTIGIAVGSDVSETHGYIVRTTDFGATWDGQSVAPVGKLTNVVFANRLTAYAVGFYGEIIVSTDGGQTWDMQKSPTNNFLYDIFFVNSTDGFIAGAWGTILKTQTGGR